MSTATQAATAPAHYGTLPHDEITALLAALDDGHQWRTALRDLQLPILSRKPDWFTNPAKAAFYLSLLEPGDETAVDIGAGSGVIAGELANRFPRVVALEQDPRWCRFMRRRFEQDDLPVYVAQGSALDIDRTGELFDLAVINGVLEWVAVSDEPAVLARTPYGVQLDFLRMVRKSLTKRGRVGIGIENRLHYENFRGASPHGEEPYAAVLPRSVADWMTWRACGERYRTWIYGPRGYARLLQRAGFTDIDVQAALPSYHRPVMHVSLDESARIRAQIGPRHGAKARVLDVFAKLGVLGHVVHSFYISARRA